MKHYAADGKLSQKELEGGIEISEQEYQDALKHLATPGNTIRIQGKKLIKTAKPERKAGHKDPVWQDGEWHHEKIPTTPEEHLAAGEITQEEADELKVAEVRSERDSRLYKLDAIVTNPLRWGALTAEQQTQAQSYRQLLLDVPQQAGFPWATEWPETPDFM